jgi:two-component sensor histidine kinase
MKITGKYILPPHRGHSPTSGFKRVIILPFMVIIMLVSGLSWLMYINGSRAALRDAVTAILVSSTKRINEEITRRFEVAALAAGADAAFLGTLPPAQVSSANLHSMFMEHLKANPAIAILAVGTVDGEYVEAQRQPGGKFRVASSGVATGGALIFKPVLEDGSFGAPSGTAASYDPRQRPWYQAAIQARGLSWSAPYSLYSNADPAIAAAAPVYSHGALVGVTSATITLGMLSDFLADVDESDQGILFVTDGDGRLIATSAGSIVDSSGNRAVASDNDDQRVARAWQTASVASTLASGLTRFSFNHDGMRYLGTVTPFSPGPNQNWRIITAVREQAYNAALLSADVRNFILLALSVLLMFAVGWYVVDYVTRPMHALADTVDSLEPGHAIPSALSTFALRNNELGRLSRSFLAMKIRLDESFASLEASLAEKNVLLKEVHHRVKNNLQIVSSILSIQSGSLEDERAKSAFEQCQNRIQTMALVHEEVYQTGSFVELSMGTYLEKICDSLRWGWDRGSCRTNVVVHVEDGSTLSVEKAIPCGLIVNELVTNALKHAFAGKEHGTITVSFTRDSFGWTLTVTDDGIGMEQASEATRNGAGIGGQLIEGLVAQLHGSIRYQSAGGGGTSVVVGIPR